MPVINSEPSDHPFPNLFLCSSNLADEQYLSFLTCGYRHFTDALLLVYPIHDISCFLSSNFLGDELIGYISHPNIMSS